MAKDGTVRGGQRVGSGKKTTKRKNVELLNTAFTDITDFATPDELEGVDVPPIKEYLKSRQKNGKDFYAEEIYMTTYLWLKKRMCENLVSRQLIEQYAMSVSRWIQCEEAISEFGFLAKHPTTGNAIGSPYVQMSQAYMKQITQVWYHIYQIVKDNGIDDVDELDPQDLMMEKLLKARRK